MADVSLGSASKLNVECSDCGRSRWLFPAQLARKGISLSHSINAVAAKLSCSSCRDDGLPGKNVSVQAFFDRDHDRQSAEAEVLRNQAALSVG